MTLEELITKEKELCSELATIREEINKMEQQKTIILLEEAIKCLVHIDSMNLGNLQCYFELYCEECETTTETIVSLEEIYNALRKLKGDIS